MQLRSCVVRDRLLGDGSQRPESGQTGGIGIRLGPRDNGRPQPPLELVARGERRVNLVELAQDAARPRLGLERIVDLEEFVSAADDGVGEVVDGRCPPGTSSMGDGPVAPVATTLLGAHHRNPRTSPRPSPDGATVRACLGHMTHRRMRTVARWPPSVR